MFIAKFCTYRKRVNFGLQMIIVRINNFTFLGNDMHIFNAKWHYISEGYSIFLLFFRFIFFNISDTQETVTKNLVKGIIHYTTDIS